MITNEQMATVLTAQLQEYAGTVNGYEFEFLIHPNEGEYQAFMSNGQRKKATILINGVLGDQVSTPLPLEGLGSTLVSQTLSFFIPIDKSKTSGRIEYAKKSIDQFVQDMAGHSGELTDDAGNEYAYVLSVSTPFIGQEGAYPQIGFGAPATCQVVWQFIKDGVVGNNVNMTLDGQKLLLLDGTGTRVGIGDATNVQNETEQKTALTQQGLLFEIVIPYKRGKVTIDGEEVLNISQQLMHDKFYGILNKVYDLTYDDNTYEDGVSQNDGISWSGRVVAKHISAPYTAGKNMVINAQFVLARED